MNIVLSFLAGLVFGIVACRLWWGNAIALASAEEAKVKAKLASIFDPTKPPSAPTT